MARQPAHFKVRLSVKNHWKTADIWADPELRAAWVGLGLLAIERFAGSTGGAMIVSGTDLASAVGCKSVSAAVKRMERLVAVAAKSWSRGPVSGESPRGQPAVTWETAGSGWRVSLSNLAKNQAFRRANSHLARPSDSDSDSDSSSKKKKRTRKPPAEPSASGLRVAEALAGMIRETDPAAKLPRSLTGWARTADEMLERDRRTEREALAAIEWLATENDRAARSGRPAFVVLSMGTLREKFDRLRHQARRDHAERDRGPGGAAGAAARIREVL